MKKRIDFFVYLSAWTLVTCLLTAAFVKNTNHNKALWQKIIKNPDQVSDQLQREAYNFHKKTFGLQSKGAPNENH